MTLTEWQYNSTVPLRVSSLKSVNTQVPLPYYSLAFCSPEVLINEHLTIGEILLGDVTQNSPYEIRVLEDVFCKVLCNRKNVTESEVNFFKSSIDDNYKVSWIVDNLFNVMEHYYADGSSFSLGFPVGFVANGSHYLYNHIRIVLEYNEVNLSNKTVYRIVRFKTTPLSIVHSYDENEKRFVCEDPLDLKKNFSLEEMFSSPSSSPPSSPPPSSPPPSSSPPPLSSPPSSSPPSSPSFVSDSTMNAKYYESEDRNINQESSANSALSSSSEPSILYTYDVIWVKSDLTWSERWDVYFMSQKYSSMIHWFPIINSIVIILLLSAIVAMILIRVLYRDISRYNEHSSIIEEDEIDETGWKLVHSDVFRKPPHSTLLVAFVGSGMQLLGMTLVTVIIAGVGFFSPDYRSRLLQFMIFLWTVMGYAAGFTSAKFYKMFNSTHWKLTTMRTALVFPLVVFAIFFSVHFVLWLQNSSAAIPLGTLIILLLLWLGISIPLVFLGAFFGYKQNCISLPVRVNRIPRQIPNQSWFMHPVISCFLGGCLPFGAMFTELFFLFTSIWQHRFYYFFGFLFLVLIILCITCAETSINLVYFSLVCEDYNWWWRSFFVSATSGVYVFLYSIYYAAYKLRLSHFTAVLIFSGYSFIISYAFFIITGSVGFIASFFFLRKIYGSIKID